MNAEYLHKVKADLVAAIIRSDDSMDKIIWQIAADQREACVKKLSEAWVNTNGKFDVNKAIAVVRTAEINEK